MFLAATGLWGNFVYSPVLRICTIAKKTPEEIAYNWVYNTTTSWTTLLLMAVCYFVMFVVLRRQGRKLKVTDLDKVNDNLDASHHRDRSKHDSRIILASLRSH